ncbi:hypothetical protein DSO57_1037363 [Entomophthora muscae]|uniref:Uncharacterized protein n=1 Tax=Entomophthora muscae TaxID=34485 RepID=A0ACC2SND8_9FUNG|nr:hypothetical protein DSO57_1037363 [Entomophthora muscae]
MIVDQNNYCGSFLSSSDLRYAVRWPHSDPLAEHSNVYPSLVPLASLLAFVEGDNAKASAFVKQGVDFATAATLTPANCAIISTPEFTMSSNFFHAGMHWRLMEMAFDASWKLLASELNDLASIESPQAGSFILNHKHYKSLGRILWRTQSLLKAKFMKGCTPKLKFIAAGCKSVHIKAIYGRKGKVYFAKQVQLEDTILFNSQTPDEYFSLIVWCKTDN